MRDKRRAVLSELTVVVRVGIAEGLVDLGKVCARVVLVDRFDKVVVHAEHERRLLAGLHAGAGRDDLEEPKRYSLLMLYPVLSYPNRLL